MAWRNRGGNYSADMRWFKGGCCGGEMLFATIVRCEIAYSIVNFGMWNFSADVTC